MANYNVNYIQVKTLLEYVNDNKIAIPEIQRPFVWNATKVRELIDSLYKGYPIGYIITWKNPNVKLKDGTTSEGKEVLIDGQQRITALSAALLGKEVLNSNYKKIKIKISFNLKEEAFAVATPAIEKSPDWIYDISKFLKPGNINTFNFCLEYSKISGIDPNVVNERINKLNQIMNLTVGRIELSSDIDIDIVTEIFIRINSQGVDLSQADFALSKISVNEKYFGNDIRKIIDYFTHFLQNPIDFKDIKENDKEFSSKDIFKKIEWTEKYKDDLYLPSYKDFLRVAFTFKFKRGKLQDLVSLLSGRDFETREYKEEIIESSFNALYDGVKEFINETNYKRFIMIVKATGIINSDLIKSKNVLNFGYALYLLMKEKKYEPNIIEKCVMKWIVFSILTQRYSGSAESIFDYDIKKFNDSSNILEYVESCFEAELSDNFWEKYLPSKLETSNQSNFWCVYLMSQIKTGDKAFLSKGHTVKSLIEERGDIHHIFPKNYLIKNGIKDKKMYNQIANFTYLQQEINIEIRDKAPKKYFEEMQKQINGEIDIYGCIKTNDELNENLKDNAIPLEIKDMTFNEYNDFLAKRRILMAEKIRDYFKNL